MLPSGALEKHRQRIVVESEMHMASGTRFVYFGFWAFPKELARPLAMSAFACSVMFLMVLHDLAAIAVFHMLQNSGLHA